MSQKNITLSCADFTFPRPTHDQVLAILEVLGFEYVDLGVFEQRSHHYPSQIAPDPVGAARQMKARLERHRLRPSDVFVQLGTEPSEAAVNDPAREIREAGRDLFARMVEFTAALGATHLTGLPGVPQAASSEAESWARAIEETRWRTERARRSGLVYAVEPHVGSICPDVSRAQRFAEESETSLTLDYGHFIYGGETSASVHPLAAHASHFHARGGAPGQLQTPLSENQIDFAGAISALRAAGYAQHLCLEYVWIDWEGCNRTDNLSETLLLREALIQLISSARTPG